MKTFLVLILVSLMAGCGIFEDPDPKAGANYITLDGTPVPEGASLKEAEQARADASAAAEAAASEDDSQ